MFMEYLLFISNFVYLLFPQPAFATRMFPFQFLYDFLNVVNARYFLCMSPRRDKYENR